MFCEHGLLLLFLCLSFCLEMRQQRLLLGVDLVLLHDFWGQNCVYCEAHHFPGKSPGEKVRPATLPGTWKDLGKQQKNTNVVALKHIKYGISTEILIDLAC